MNKHQENACDTSPFSYERELCCKKDKDDDYSTAYQQGCVGAWKQEQKKYREKKTKAEARLSKANETYKKVLSWKNILKRWKEDAETAHDKAIDFNNELNRMIMAVDRTEATKTAKGVEAILCLVKSIFNEVNDLLVVNGSAEESNGGNQDSSIQKLKEWIECDQSLDANKKEQALKCILPFEEQMKVVDAARDDLLKKLLDILHSSNLLVALIGKQEESKDGMENKAGLKWQLEDLRNRVTGKKQYTTRDRRGCGIPKLPNPPCKSDIVNPSTLFFPINKSEYYCDINSLYKDALIKAEAAELELVESQKSNREAVDKFNKYKQAIEAAEAAQSAN